MWVFPNEWSVESINWKYWLLVHGKILVWHIYQKRIIHSVMHNAFSITMSLCFISPAVARWENRGKGSGRQECIVQDWGLKTLFNFVEAPSKELLNSDNLCCMMMFRCTNKQPGIQKFWNLPLSRYLWLNITTE